MSSDLTEKDDLSVGNLAWHTELCDNRGHQRVTNFLLTLSPSSVPATAPILPTSDGATSVCSSPSELHHRRHRSLAHKQDTGKSTQVTVPIKGSRTVSIHAPSSRAEFIQALVTRAPSSHTSFSRAPSHLNPSNRDPSNRDPSNRDPSDRDPSNRDTSNRDPSVLSKRKPGDDSDDHDDVSETTRPSRGEYEHRRTHQQSETSKKSKSQYNSEIPKARSREWSIKVTGKFQNFENCHFYDRI
ncbi:hypothetical protein BGZ99_000602 [Dissophora globulifera]|uniref:Uncharacterized protein n=1 Tax=Dissophora globulifera TaxID=979702 RepID=A0A9P6R4S3_9FUNG|nr:hypothetical protein BGZ99_000602 [Dissophora globulifera]